MAKKDNVYRFYYRLEANIDGLSIIFRARARPDGKWKDENLSMAATCSTEVDAVLREDTQAPVLGKRKRSTDEESSPIPPKRLRQDKSPMIADTCPEPPVNIDDGFDMTHFLGVSEDSIPSPPLFEDLFRNEF